MKRVLLAVHIGFVATSVAQPLGPIIDLNTGKITGFAQQEGEDIVILNPNGGMTVILNPEPNRPNTPVLVNPSTNATDPKSTISTATRNTQGK